jgi:hypothetical protein
MSTSSLSQQANAETCCDLDLEFTQEDEELLEKLELTAEQLKLKDENVEAFWKMVDETIRSKLSDLLADNREVNSTYKIKH